MGCGNFPISDLRTLAMIFHPLITLPTDVRSARFFGGFFSTLVDDDLGFVDVGSGVCVGTSTFARFCKREILLFFASLVRLLVFGFRFSFAVSGMDQISKLYEEFLLSGLNLPLELRGFHQGTNQLVVLRLQSPVLRLGLL